MNPRLRLFVYLQSHLWDCSLIDNPLKLQLYNNQIGICFRDQSTNLTSNGEGGLRKIDSLIGNNFSIIISKRLLKIMVEKYLQLHYNYNWNYIEVINTIKIWFWSAAKPIIELRLFQNGIFQNRDFTEQPCYDWKNTYNYITIESLFKTKYYDWKYTYNHTVTT